VLNIQPLTTGLQSFAMTSQQLFILQAATRTTDSSGVNTDLVISPISRAEYLALPNKAQQGSRPVQFYLERTIVPNCYVWPTCQDNTVSIVYYSANMVQDPGAYTNTMNIPQRWMDALASACAYRLAVKFAPERAIALKTLSDEAYGAAATEDTENVPMRIVPDTMGRRFG
jgi:hypothetical protein